MPSISYREATQPDIPSLAKLRAANSGTEEGWTNRITGYLNGTVNPQKALPPRIVYVAEEKNNVIGFIAGHLTRRYDCDGELEWIDVAFDCRRSGVATTLVKLLANWFIDQQAFKICIDPGNETARQFYKKNGAEELNEHWLYWKDVRVTFS
jgi:GNAT superfamily N-acetyltransferase